MGCRPEIQSIFPVGFPKLAEPQSFCKKRSLWPFLPDPAGIEKSSGILGNSA
jgi:hypothetical protein